MTPFERSWQPRHSPAPYMQQRRAIAGLSLAAMGALGMIALRQIGVLPRLPDLPFASFETNRIVTSDEAYAHFNMPDGVLGLGNFAATLGLAAMGGPARATEQPLIPLALAAKAMFDVAMAGSMLIKERNEFHALCLWCMLAASTTVASAALALPEARAAWRHVMEDKP
jgi:uncharacterized membrane protein